MNVVWITLILVGCLGAAEVAARVSGLSAALSRKLVHTGTALAACATAVWFGYRNYIWVGLVFLVLLSAARRWFPLHSLSDRSESYGEVWFPVGVTLAALVAPTTEVFVAAILILGVCDTVAYYAGTGIRSPELLFGKTLAGSVGFALVATAISAWLVPWPAAMLIGCLSAVAEHLSPRGSDNLTVPVVASALLAALV